MIGSFLNGLIAGVLEGVAKRILEYREGDKALADAQVLVVAAQIIRENRHITKMEDSK